MDLEVILSSGAVSGDYVVEASSDAGVVTGDLQLDIEGLLAKRQMLESAVVRSALSLRRVDDNLEKPVRQVGEQLFTSLFDGPVYARYRTSIAMARERREPLRLVLHLREPELTALPWEMLFDTAAGEYVCHTEPLVRHVDVPVPEPPATVNSALRILGINAAPTSLAQLDVSAEQEGLESALRKPMGQGRIELVWTTGGRWSDVQDALLDGPWHIVHFIGHGGYDKDHEEGQLALAGDRGTTELIGARQFSRLLEAAAPAPRLVVLNSCSSAEAGEDDLFSSTAASLVRSGIAAVVAMQYSVSNAAASAFSGGLYSAIAHNRSIGQAVQNGRIAINGISQHTLEWVTPVVYLRGDEVQLFDVTPGKNIRRGPTSEPDDDELTARLDERYHEALALVRVGQTEAALAILESILAVDPDYHDAAARRDALRRTRRAARTYEEARAAERAGRLGVAERAYQTVLEIDPEHEDARARADGCRTKRRTIDLTAELRIHAAEGRDDAVISAGAELAGLDPGAADPDGLVTAARQRSAPSEDTTSQTRRRRRRIALAVGVAAVIVLVIVLVIGAAITQRSSTEVGGTPVVPVRTADDTSNSLDAIRLIEPRGLLVDGDDNLFVAESNRVRRVDTNGDMTAFAGTGVSGFAGDGGPAVDALLNAPDGAALDDDGNVYIADFDNHRIRRIDTDGTITTIAGTGSPGFSGDEGPAVDATLNHPTAAAIGRDGNVYFSDLDNNRIRRIDNDGTITTIAGTGPLGSGGDGGLAVFAELGFPQGIAFDAAGNLYLADDWNHRIRKIDTDGIITTIAGTGSPGFGGDGGPARDAVLSSPFGVAIGDDGSIYIAEPGNKRIRKIDPQGIITTVAGNGVDGFSGDGGPAVDAALGDSGRIALADDGTLYISDIGNQRVRKVDTEGIITTVAL